MSFTGTEIDDPAELRKAGQGALDLAGETKKAGNRPLDETRAASQGFSQAEWDGGLGKALSELSETWSRQLNSLQADCVLLGGQCIDTSEAYSTVESTNSAVMGNAGREVNSPFG
ncbi:hypothetical protein ACGH2B_06615 [Streptomyces sp. BBFR2]|uniref:hypothetical protein n=1 Tax=Streptomyces sp. BBFR2 TaxID=3372854 RepID=UPI0037DA2421